MTRRQGLTAVLGTVLLWCLILGAVARAYPKAAPSAASAPARGCASELAELDAKGRRMVAYDRIGK